MKHVSQYEKIFYSGEVDKLMNYELGGLPYRSEKFVLEKCEKKAYQDVAVVNYPNNYDFTRIHEYKYYLDDVSDVTIISKEYPEEYVPGKNEPYYPIPNECNEMLHSHYVDLIKEHYPNMIPVGRLGSYKYYNMDESVKRAMDVVNELFE